MQFVEIILQRARALQPHRLAEHFGGDIGVAVAIAADPGADAQERGDALVRIGGVPAREFVLDGAIEARQFAEERVVVIGEAVCDLVDDAQPRLTQHVGAPQQQHGAAQLLFRAREFGVIALLALARVEQRGDFEFAHQRALAPHFGGMGGEHRADQRAVEEIAQRPGADAQFARMLEGVAEGARARRRAAHDVGAVAADVVLVLGDIGQMREIAEGAHDRERLVVVEAVERGGELAPRAALVVAMEADRGLPDSLDNHVNVGAFLLAHGVAEDAAEQADVVAQRGVLFIVLVRRGGDGEFLGDRGGQIRFSRRQAWPEVRLWS